MKIRTILLLGLIMLSNLEASPPIMESKVQETKTLEPIIIEKPIIPNEAIEQVIIKNANEDVFFNPNIKMIQESFNKNNIKAIKDTPYNKNKVFK